MHPRARVSCVRCLVRLNDFSNFQNLAHHASRDLGSAGVRLCSVRLSKDATIEKLKECYTQSSRDYFGYISECGAGFGVLTIPTHHDFPVRIGSWLYYDPVDNSQPENRDHEKNTIRQIRTRQNKFLKEPALDLKDLHPLSNKPTNQPEGKTNQPTRRTEVFQYSNKKPNNDISAIQRRKPNAISANHRRPKRCRGSKTVEPQFAFKLEFLNVSNGGPCAKIEIKLINNTAEMEEYFETAIFTEAKCWVTDVEPSFFNSSPTMNLMEAIDQKIKLPDNTKSRFSGASSYATCPGTPEWCGTPEFSPAASPVHGTPIRCQKTYLGSFSSDDDEDF